MYSIDGLWPTGQPLGGYGFMIHLSPQFREAVAKSDVNQEGVERVIKTYGVEWMQKCGLCGYFDPESCGFGAEKHAIPSDKTKVSLGGCGRRTGEGQRNAVGTFTFSRYRTLGHGV